MKQSLSPIILELLNYARLAPSVHNIQPWHFNIINKDTISLAAAPKRLLSAGDPTGRQSWISLGICLEAILQAAKGLGIEARVADLQTNSLHESIATIRFILDEKLEKQPSILHALKKRQTYREKMQPTLIPPGLLESCRMSIVDLRDVDVFFMQDKADIRHVGQLTLKAMTIALSGSDFRHELAHLLHSNWSPSLIGLHGYTFGEGVIGSILGKLSMKLGIGLSVKARHDQQRVSDASMLVFIATRGDVPSFWLKAGQAYLRVALQITQAGLAQGTITAPIEAPHFHEDIEKLLGTSMRLQSMIRVGRATRPVRSSPRLSIEELTSP